MEFKFFTDLIDALGKVATGLKALVQLPKAEREFRLCRSLRFALLETESLAGHLACVVSTKDWDGLLKNMRAILTTEQEVALFIGQKFQHLAEDARVIRRGKKRIQSLRNTLTAVRTSLLAERQALIKQETELYDSV
ncbi:MAG: hypothetical protein KC643_25415 [Nitrospira sp.]|nr:hypothetical protein [Nitrospira sp.]